MIAEIAVWEYARTASTMFETGGKKRHNPHEEGMTMLYYFYNTDENNNTFYDEGHRPGANYTGIA